MIIKQKLIFTEAFYMNIFKTFHNELSYKDVLQLDGAFSVCHINYDKSPIFNGIDSKDMAKKSRKNSLSYEDKIEDVVGCIYSFDGTEKILNKTTEYYYGKAIGWNI